MEAGDLRWPNPDLLTAKARNRLKELRNLVDWYKLSSTDYEVIQKELDILSKMTKGASDGLQDQHTDMGDKGGRP